MESKELFLSITGFTEKVRRGYYRKGKHVTVHTPQVALVSISKTINMEGGVSPIYQENKKYIVPIQCQIEGNRRKDLPTTQKVAIPVATVNLAYKIRNKSNNAAEEAAAQLCIFAFYFLLSIV